MQGFQVKEENEPHQIKPVKFDAFHMISQELPLGKLEDQEACSYLASQQNESTFQSNKEYHPSMPPPAPRLKPLANPPEVQNSCHDSSTSLYSI